MIQVNQKNVTVFKKCKPPLATPRGKLRLDVKLIQT